MLDIDLKHRLALTHFIIFIMNNYHLIESNRKWMVFEDLGVC